jgi:hypothetical protein
MVKLTKILKSLSLFKGKFFTAIGVVLIALSVKVMYSEKAITSEGIELLTVGLILSGVTDETISHIRGNSDKSV